MFIGAIFTWGIITDAGSLTTWLGTHQKLANISVSTVALPGGEECFGLALWADESVEELLGVGFVNL
jgi:hypothetical protein